MVIQLREQLMLAKLEMQRLNLEVERLQAKDSVVSSH